MDDKKGGGLGPVRTIILIVAIGVFCYSAYQLFTMYRGYKAADDEYSELAESFTKPVAGAGGSSAVSVETIAESAAADVLSDGESAGAETLSGDAGIVGSSDENTGSGVENADGAAGAVSGADSQSDAADADSGADSQSGAAGTDSSAESKSVAASADSSAESRSGASSADSQSSAESQSGAASADSSADSQSSAAGKSGSAAGKNSSAADQKSGTAGKNSGTQAAASGKNGKHAPLKVVTATPAEKMLIEDAKAPLEVDWKELKEINPEVVGWIYIDGQDNISYPVCRADNNEFYLHQTFRKQYLYAGSIFEDYHNKPDFADPNTIVYGHNMKNGSMFGMLKYMNDQKKYDEHPFFWILTPDGNYRYHIFSIFTTGAESDTYTLYTQNGPEFLAWEEKMQKQSNVKNKVPLSKSDKTVILSTCTSDSSVRCVVIGKCVSSTRPKRKAATGPTMVTPTTPTAAPEA